MLKAIDLCSPVQILNDVFSLSVVFAPQYVLFPITETINKVYLVPGDKSPNVTLSVAEFDSRRTNCEIIVPFCNEPTRAYVSDVLIELPMRVIVVWVTAAARSLFSGLIDGAYGAVNKLNITYISTFTLLIWYLSRDRMKI